MTDPLVGVRAKLNRANFHLDTLEGEVIASLAQPQGQPFRLCGKFDAERRRYVQQVESMPTIPLVELGLIIGDCVHNLRCALDHLSWQLVKHGSDPNPKRPRDVQYPIYDDIAGFRYNLDRRLPGVPLVHGLREIHAEITRLIVNPAILTTLT